MSSTNGSIPSSQSHSNGCGYSALVRLYLEQNNTQFPLAQVGGGRLYFDEPIVLPAGLAEVIVELDGAPERIAIVLSGNPKPSRVVKYLPA